MIDFRNIPPVTKNLLIANIVAFIATSIFPNLETQFSLFMFNAPQFKPYQILTHMFIHADFRHLFFKKNTCDLKFIFFTTLIIFLGLCMFIIFLIDR